jgi:hypothetical protein
MTGTTTPAYSLIWGLGNFLPRLVSNLDLADLPLPSSCDYRVSHRAPSMYILVKILSLTALMEK